MALSASLPPAVLDRDGATLDPAEFAQQLHKCVDLCAQAYWAAPTEVPDGRQLPRLLRTRRERPRGRAAEQRNEGAALHSITSSARSRKDSGIVNPSALAVVKLMTR